MPVVEKRYYSLFFQMILCMLSHWDVFFFLIFNIFFLFIYFFNFGNPYKFNWGKKGSRPKGGYRGRSPTQFPTLSPGCGACSEILNQVVPIVHHSWVAASLATPSTMWSLKSPLIDTVPSRVSICPVFCCQQIAEVVAWLVLSFLG